MHVIGFILFVIFVIWFIWVLISYPYILAFVVVMGISAVILLPLFSIIDRSIGSSKSRVNPKYHTNKYLRKMVRDMSREFNNMTPEDYNREKYKIDAEIAADKRR